MALQNFDETGPGLICFRHARHVGHIRHGLLSLGHYRQTQSCDNDKKRYSSAHAILRHTLGAFWNARKSNSAVIRYAEGYEPVDLRQHRESKWQEVQKPEVTKM